MSISDGALFASPSFPGLDFAAWLPAVFASHGSFTALVVLVDIGETTVTPLASTFLTIVGDEMSWAELVALFAGSGRRWSGACLFPQLDEDGPLENAAARSRLRALEARLNGDRLVLNEGAFFDAAGRRMAIAEITPS